MIKWIKRRYRQWYFRHWAFPGSGDDVRPALLSEGKAAVCIDGMIICRGCGTYMPIEQEGNWPNWLVSHNCECEW